jgi:hypothetical protein
VSSVERLAVCPIALGDRHAAPVRSVGKIAIAAVADRSVIAEPPRLRR